MTMTDFRIQRDALLQALYHGILTVKAGDKSVTFKLIKQMRNAHAMLDKEISALEYRRKVTHPDI